MNRRRFVAGLALGGVGSLAGCLSSNDDSGEVRGEYTGDPATQFEDGCHRGEIFEDQFRLSGTLTSRVMGTSTVEWHIDIEAGEHLVINVASREPRDTHPDPPTVEFVDPDGNVLLDRADGQSTYDITLGSTGAYVLRVHSGELTGRHWWNVEVYWDPYEEC